MKRSDMVNYQDFFEVIFDLWRMTGTSNENNTGFRSPSVLEDQPVTNKCRLETWSITRSLPLCHAKNKQIKKKMRRRSNYLELTSLPLSNSTFAIRAMKTNLGSPPFPISATGFPDSLISYEKIKQQLLSKEKYLTNNKFNPRKRCTALLCCVENVSEWTALI